MVGGNYQNMTPEMLQRAGESIGFAESGGKPGTQQPFGGQDKK